MTEVPNIVHDRLRAAAPMDAASRAAHPDANLLTAFAEQALSATEREGVLEHLALCGDCREVVTLALPPAEIVATSVAGPETVRTTPIAAKSEKRWISAFGWPGLRWAALAAVIVVAGSVLLSHRGDAPTLTPTSSPAISTATAPPPVSEIAPPPTDQVASLDRADVAKSKSEMYLSKKLRARKEAAEPVPAESGILIADKKDSGPANKPSAGLTAGARSFAYDESPPRGLNEQVEVSPSAAAVATEASPSVEGKLMARNEAPAIEKAKPAPQALDLEQQKVESQVATVSGQAAAVSTTVSSLPLNGRNVMTLERMKVGPSVTWTITRGVLRRSTDSGKSWQNAVRADHPLLCYAPYDEDVWTGGRAGTLFHSADGGVTWTQVHPSIKAQPLSADITHIDVRGPAEVVILTNNTETWSTADGGKTWEKK